MRSPELARVAVTLLAAAAVSSSVIPQDSRTVSWVVSVAAAQTHGSQDQEQAANTLFVEALQQIEAAGRATSAIVRLDMLRQAQANLDRIVQDYTGSQLAVQLITGQRIGAFDPRALADTLSEAEEDRICAQVPDACALFADALETARVIPLHAYRAEALARASIAQAAAQLTNQSRRSLAAAVATLRETPWIWEGWHFAEALTAIAAAQATSGALDDARNTFADALAATDELSSREERGAALLLIAATQAEAGLFDDALTTARQVGPRNCRFRARAIAEVGAAQAQADLIEDARRTMEEAAAAGREPQCLGGGYRTDPPLAIAEAQAAAGFREDARRSFADALTRAHAEGILVFGRVGALADIAAAQAEAGFADDAEQTLAEVLIAASESSEAFHLPTAVADIAVAQSRLGQLGAALTTAGELPREYERAIALSAVGAEQHAAGFTDDARQIFAEAAIAAAGTERRDPQADVLATVAIAQADAGWFDDALATIGQMPSDAWPSHRVEALAAVGAAQAAAGSLAEAQRTFAEALAAANDLDPSYETGRSEAVLEIAKAQILAAAAILAAE